MSAAASRRSASEPEVSIVVPFGDHEEVIGYQIRAIAAHMRALGRSFEIVAVNDGCRDNSVSIASLLMTAIPELRVLPVTRPGRSFLRGAAEARGTFLVLSGAAKQLPLGPLGWALTRLESGADAVILRGRYIVARRLAALPVIVRSTGTGALFEALFERRALAHGLPVEIAGTLPRRRERGGLLRPVLRFLAA